MVLKFSFLVEMKLQFVCSNITLVCRATRLGREHHDDLAQFMLGMGYATEALHLPGISKRFSLPIFCLISFMFMVPIIGFSEIFNFEISFWYCNETLC